MKRARTLVDEASETYTENTSGLGEADYAAIGRIAVESAYLELEVTRILLGIASLKPAVGELFLEGTMLRKRLDLLEGVASMRLSRRKKKLAEFKSLVGAMRTNNAKRVMAVHGTWVTLLLSDLAGITIPGPRAIMTARKKAGPVELRLTEAIALSQDIQKSRRELLSFAAKTWPRLFGLRLPGIPN